MDSTASDPQTETPAEVPTEAIPADDTAPTLEAAPEPVAEPVAEPVQEAQVPLAVHAGVGTTLRAARQAMGKDLPECSKLLRIRQAFLEALEEGRHRDLPGGTYATGFLRSYAEFLGLDSEEMIRRFREEGAGGFKNRTELTFPSPVSEGRIPGGAIIFLGLILAALVYGGWYLVSSVETKVTEMVPPLPERLAGLLHRPASLTGDAKPAEEAKPADDAKPAEDASKAKDDVVPPQEAEDDKGAAQSQPAQPGAAQPQAPQADSAASAAKPEPAKLDKAPVETAQMQPAQVQPAKVEPPKVEAPKAEPAKPESAKVEPPKAEPAKPEPAKVEAPKAEPAKPEIAKAEPAKVEPPKAEAAPAESAKPDTAGLPEGKIYGTEYADSRVVLRATGDDCWIQVREMDGSLLMSRLLRRGDSFRVPNRSGLNLMVGNAGALEVRVDGRKAPPLGATGQVRRDIRLDPDKLSSGG